MSNPSDLSNLSKATRALEAKLDKHENILPFKRLMIVLISLLLAAHLNMIEASAFSIASPYIAAELDASKTIQWGSTSLLISGAIFTTIGGRMADIFGRKWMLIASCLILAVFDIGCGFAQRDYQFFIFRGFAGIGNGVLTSMSLIMLSDIVPIEKRGVYQGMLGFAWSSGVAVGPFYMALFVKHTQVSWRGFYYLWAPLFVTMALLCYFTLPDSKSDLSNKEILKNFDYLGTFLVTACLLLFLIPINMGGVMYPWKSTIVIVMFVLSGVLFCCFLYVEARVAKLPMVPLRLFHNVTIINLFVQSFLYGIVYASVLYYVPFFVEVVLNKPIMKAAGFFAANQFALAFASVISGKLLEIFNGFNKTIILGYCIWSLGNGLTLLFKENSNDGTVAVVLILIGCGIGFNIQSTIIAVQAHSTKQDRALILSLRNVIRAIGSTLGTAFSSLIFTNALISNTNRSDLPSNLKEYIIDNAYAHPDFSLFDDNQKVILVGLLMKSFRNIFILWIPVIGVCLVCAFFVKDHSLSHQKSEKEEAEENAEHEIELIVSKRVDVAKKEPKVDIATGLFTTDSKQLAQ